MMMAFDASRTPPSRLDDETIASVRDALRGYLANANHASPLRQALLLMATEARGKTMVPEQLLVVLKELWGGLAEVRAMADLEQQIRLQQRVVTMCIKEYYSAG